MNSFLAPKNRTSLTGIIDFTAHNIYLAQEDGTANNILDILFPYGDIAVAELVDAQLNDLGPVIQMYQIIGDINDERVPGSESILNYINENFLIKQIQRLMGTVITLQKHLILNAMKNIIAINNNISQLMLIII